MNIMDKANPLINAYRAMDRAHNAYTSDRNTKTLLTFELQRTYVEAMTTTIRHLVPDESVRIIGYAQEQRLT